MAQLTFHYPVWWTYWGKADTREELLKRKKEGEQLEVKNREVAAQMRQLKAELVRQAETLWGKKSNVVRYLDKQPLPSAPSLVRHIENVIARVDKEQKAQEAKEAESAKAQAAALKHARAVAFLAEHGQFADKDYGIEAAINVANDLRYEQLVAERLAQAVVFDFSGDDYCKDCGGWDGESHRCFCGNRRVYWEAMGDFENMHIYAVAY